MGSKRKTLLDERAKSCDTRPHHATPRAPGIPPGQVAQGVKMSATRAAQALLLHDADVACFAASMEHVTCYTKKREAVLRFVRHDVMGTWGLAVAAHAAGVSEEQVIAALLHLEPLRFGTTCVCRGEARRMFGEVA